MTASSGREAPSFADVEAAAARLAGIANRTPVITSRRTDERVGASVFFKAENLQRGGAFKFRGAYNTLSELVEAGHHRGVVAYSSGNHAQAVALAAKLLGLTAVIVMPSDAPKGKRAATEGYGAEVITFDRMTQDRVAIATEFAEQNGLALVPPFDHRPIIAGQATAALELFEEVGDLDILMVSVGGGGLLAGTLLAAAQRCPSCAVIGVEPEAGDDVRQAVARGERVRIEVPATIADGAQTTEVGELNFPIIANLVERIDLASDSDLVEAMEWMFQTTKLVVEPTGCLGLAGLFNADPDEVAGRRVGVILSGGNVDAARFGELIG